MKFNAIENCNIKNASVLAYSEKEKLSGFYSSFNISTDGNIVIKVRTSKV